MPALVDEYAPDDPRQRLAVAVALVTLGVPVTLYGFFAVWWPIQMWLYVGELESMLVMFAGLFAVVSGHGLLKGVAERADDRDPTAESATGESAVADATDPVATLKRRYAAGDLTEAEFDRRLERLRESDHEDASERERPETLLE